jgi:hypothetical protein
MPIAGRRRLVDGFGTDEASVLVALPTKSEGAEPRGYWVAGEARWAAVVEHMEMARVARVVVGWYGKSIKQE